jgi:hypothetical protein
MASSYVESDPLGSDFAGVFDLSPSLSFVWGRRAHLESTARGLLQSPGAEPDAPEDGLGLDLLIGEDFDARDIEGRAERQCLRDERTVDAKATAVVNEDTGEIELTVGIDGATGPFVFVLSPTRITSDLLKLKV